MFRERPGCLVPVGMSLGPRKRVHADVAVRVDEAGGGDMAWELEDEGARGSDARALTDAGDPSAFDQDVTLLVDRPGGRHHAEPAEQNGPRGGDPVDVGRLCRVLKRSERKRFFLVLVVVVLVGGLRRANRRGGATRGSQRHEGKKEHGRSHGSAL
jgi:hypothetical protein